MRGLPYNPGTGDEAGERAGQVAPAVGVVSDSRRQAY